MDEPVSPGLSPWDQSSVAAGCAQGNSRKGGECAPRLSGHAKLGVSGDVGDVYMYLQWESKRRNEAGSAWYRRSHTPTGHILLALWWPCRFQPCGTKAPAKVIAIIDLGHLGLGLTLKSAGSDAFKMICRPDLGVAYTGPKALASSDLIGAWFQAPSQYCPLAWPARHPPGGRNDRSRRSTR